MVGVLIQTMPMLSLVLGAQSCCVGLGGDVPGAPSGVDSPVSSRDRAGAEHFAGVPALEGALPCHFCPCRACCRGACRGIFPGSPLPLCFQLPGGGRGLGQLPGAELQAAGPSRLLWKGCQSALPSLRESWSHWGCRGGRLISPGRCHLWGSGFSLSAWELLVTGPQCHSSVQLDMGIPRKEHSSCKLFLVLWRVQSHDCQTVIG